MAKSDFCEKLCHRSLPDSPDSGEVPALTELWRHFYRRHYSSVGRTHRLVCCPHMPTLQVHIHAPVPEAREFSLCIISGILVLISLRKQTYIHPVSNMRMPSVLPHILSLPWGDVIFGSISHQNKNLPQFPSPINTRTNLTLNEGLPQL